MKKVGTLQLWAQSEDCGSIDSPCECEHNNPDSLDARLFFTVVLAVASAVTMDEASSLSGSARIHLLSSGQQLNRESNTMQWYLLVGAAVGLSLFTDGL